MVAQMLHFGREFIVVGGDCPTFAPGSQILARVEAEASGLTNGSRLQPADAIADARTMCLAGILDQLQTVSVGDLAQLDQRRRQAVQMDWHDGARAVRRSEVPIFKITFQRRHAQVAGVGIDIDKRRRRARLHYRFGGGPGSGWARADWS